MDKRPHHFAILFSVIIILILGFAVTVKRVTAQASAQKVFVIPVTGTVDPGMSAFIKRALERSSDSRESIFVIEIDTFGGRVDSALQIVDTLLSVSEGKTVAFVRTKAISAGSLIALSCSRLVMKPGTTIGDCAPITYSQEGPKSLGEKFQSPLRAKFRTLARRNGYPETLAESMVTKEIEVYAVEMDGKKFYMSGREYKDLSKEEKERISSKKTVVAKGELLTMDDTEAREYGFSKMSVASIDEMLQRLGVKSYELVRVQESWSEAFVRFIGAITPYLLMIGLAALYTEIKAPGFGVPGIVGILCLALVFLNQYMVGLADYTELLIVAAGLVLLGFEMFVIPGFGIAGIAGLVLIAVSAILALQDFVIPDPAFPWEGELLVKNVMNVLTAFFIAFIAALFFLRYVLPKLSLVVQGPYLDATLEESHADSIETGSIRAGEIGIAMTFLRPSGKIQVNNEMFDAITEGEFLEKETPVKVLEIRGNRVIVARRSGDE